MSKFNNEKFKFFCITDVIVTTDLEGYDDSRTSFTGDSVSLNWESLPFNPDTVLEIELVTSQTTSQTVPEPSTLLTIFSAGTALGFGAAFKRKRAKKKADKA